MRKLKLFFQKTDNPVDDERRVLLSVIYFCLGAAALSYLSGIHRNLTVMFAVVMVCCLLLVLRDVLWPVKLVIPLTGLAVFDYLIFNNYGLRDISILGFPIIIIAAGLLSGWRGSLVFGGASLVSVMFLAWGESNGVVTNNMSSYNSFVDYMAVFILISLVTVAQWAVIKRMDDVLNRARAENVERRRTELSLRAILDNLPYWAWLKDAESRFITVNKPLAHSYGFEDTDALVGKSDFDVTELGLAKAYRADDIAVMQSRVQRFVEETVMDNGTERWVETFKSPIFDDQGHAIGTTGFVRDITERKLAEESLRQRDAIMDAVAFAAEKFLQTHDWRANIQAVLTFLGERINASHTYIAENHTAPDGSPLTSLRYEWSAPGVEPDIDDPIFQNVPFWEDGFGAWAEVLSRGEAFYGNLHTFSPEEAEFIRQRGVKSMLEVPIFVGDTWWGIIGYDDEVNEREWSLAEMDALKVAASIVSAAIQRQRADSALRESEQLYRAAIEAAGAAPYYQDYELGVYSFMSDGIRSLTGYTPEEMTPHLWNDIVQEAIILGEGQGLPENEVIRRVRNGEIESWKCDYLIRTRDGQLRWIANSAVEVRNEFGISRGSIGILQDITERKWALEEVQRLNADLEKRVLQRTAQLEATNKELEAFSYSVSHDLRAPLRSINGYTNILLRDFGAHLDEQGQNFLEKVVKSSQEMNELIESLLSLSRLNRGELRRVNVDLTRMAKTIIESLCQSDPERPVTCLVAEGLLANADERLVHIVLENLLGNAWKYTSKTKNPRIEFGALENNGATIYFVRDNGAGFDMRYADKLFGTFQRLHNSNDFPGHGIGLATAQRIIHRHDGKIWAEAKTGEGAAFYFTLPA